MGEHRTQPLDEALDGADDAVLDSYHDERHPIGKRVLLQSGLMARGVTLHPRPARWLRNRVAPRQLRGTALRYGHRAGESALVGSRGTQIPVEQGRLTELKRHFPGFVLVRERGARPADVGKLLQVERTDDGPAALLRPDGYIAWAGDSADRAGWVAALTRWTGGRRYSDVIPTASPGCCSPSSSS